MTAIVENAEIILAEEPSFVGGSSMRDYVTLMKPGVMLLVVFSGLAGMVMAPGHLHPLLQIITLLCIAIGSGAGGAINMWYDRDIDAHMLRTANRPVPAGRIAADDALAFGLVLAVSSVAMLGLAVNWLAAAYLAGAIAFYVIIYTMILKRRTPQNIVIGGAAGAFPPIIGWAAVTGNVTFEPWILFAIVFLWTPPHFWALALYRNSDYTKVGVPMLPVVAGKAHTKKQMLVYTLILFLCSLLPVTFNMSGIFYGISATILGGLFIRHAWRVLKSDDDKIARAMFGYSILYLFILLSALIVDQSIPDNIMDILAL